MAFLKADIGDVIYFRVERPRIFGKYSVAFELLEYIYHPVSKVKVEASRRSMECEYVLEGKNLLEQCYDYAKKEVGFETVDC
ncbi:hypothetical protein LZ620_08010 [Aeromonas salmonicida]|uniref:hypothetical protein n=1 Tax=Aeromonas dhakensis TaxID=196024 RepID=UPI001F354512|nr:hypothetical protein [Aeromonas salmonicida]